MAKKLCEMTLEDAERVFNDFFYCKGRACSNCHADTSIFVGNCRKTAEHAIRLLIEAAKENAARDTEKDATPTTLEYESTINLMKRRGYHHCYMCGANLEN